jgi:hypothetical protein
MALRLVGYRIGQNEIGYAHADCMRRAQLQAMKRQREGAERTARRLRRHPELLEALSDPKHPNHADAKQWSEDYDPGTFDELPIKYALGRIANPRNAARTRLAKKKPLGSAA